jgi:hypothetical protein
MMDCCADLLTVLPQKTTVYRPLFAPCFCELINSKEHGALCVTSSSEGEVSWCPEEGALFTEAFLKLADSTGPPSHSGSDDQSLTWIQFAKALEATTSESYSSFRRTLLIDPNVAPSLGEGDILKLFRQTTQTPVVIINEIQGP